MTVKAGERPSSFIPSSFPARFAASLASGALAFACFPPLSWSWLVWVATLPLLLGLALETKLSRGFLLGYIHGAAFLGLSCNWFTEVMQQYGKLSLGLAVGAWLLFVLVFSVFFGAFGLLVTLAGRGSPRPAHLLSPFVWVAMELARTYLITGVPWNLLGYAVQPEGLRRLASVTAVYGLSFLAVVTSALLSEAVLSPRRRATWVAPAGWMILLFAANRLFPPPALPAARSTAVLVQPNVPLDIDALESWIPGKNPEPLDRLVALSLTGVQFRKGPSSGETLIVWAENPAPFYFTRDSRFRDAMEKMARRGRAYVILNTVTFAGPGDAHPKNTAVVLDPEGRELVQYDKIHLVPFGEYVPWWAFPGKVGKITSQVGDYVPGTGYRIADTPQGRIGCFICYEAIFPQLVRRLTHAGAGVLVNISNDAWYGGSPAAAQHLEMARLRAIENCRYLLRATNDGITVVIDPFGRVVKQIPRHQAAILTEKFEFLNEQTFYTAHGDWFAWGCVTAAGMLVVWGIWRARRKAELAS